MSATPASTRGLNRRSFSFVAAAVGLLAAAPLGARVQAQPASAAGAPTAALNLRIAGDAHAQSIRPRVMANRHGVASRPRPR